MTLWGHFVISWLVLAICIPNLVISSSACSEDRVTKFTEMGGSGSVTVVPSSMADVHVKFLLVFYANFISVSILLPSHIYIILYFWRECTIITVSDFCFHLYSCQQKGLKDWLNYDSLQGIDLSINMWWHTMVNNKYSYRGKYHRLGHMQAAHGSGIYAMLLAVSAAVRNVLPVTNILLSAFSADCVSTFHGLITVS